MADSKEFLKVVDTHSIPDGFIKVTDKPVTALTSEQKAVLNRKGNVLFNDGKYNEAARIFVTTGYSDGLTRIGDLYMKNDKSLTALKYYILAKNSHKAGPIYEKISVILACLLK